MKNHTVRHDERIKRPSSMDRFVRKDDPLEEARNELRYILHDHFLELSKLAGSSVE